MVSKELPAKKAVERTLPVASGLPALAIKEPFEYAAQEGKTQLCKKDLQKLKKGVQRITNLPIQYEDPTGAHISQIVAIIRRHHRRNKIKVVVVDYLQLVNGDFRLSKEQQMSQISHALQGLAKELDICMILLSQQNKEGGTKHAESITEDADLFISIAQDRAKTIGNDPNPNFGKYLGLACRKDRHNGNGGSILPVILNKDLLKFTELRPYDFDEHLKS